MAKVKNYLFINRDGNFPCQYSHSRTDNLHLISSKSIYNSLNLKKLDNYYKEIILVNNYLNAGEVEIKVRDLHQKYSLDRIVIFGEEDILRAARLRKFLNLPGQSYESALAFRDKFIMKSHLQRAGISLPQFIHALSAIDVQEFYERYGLPLIAKPLRGTHSLQTYLIQNKKELDQFLAKPRHFDEFHSSFFEVETFIEGIMYQIDGVIRDGRILAVWPSRYINTSLNMLNGKIFGSHLLSTDNPLTERLNKYAYKIIHALPFIKDTVFHLEVFHTPQDEIIFCEIASRVGGGPTRDFWIQSFGIDLAKEFLKLQLGKEPSEELNYFPKKTKVIPGIIMYPPQKGKTIKYIEKKCDFPWVEKYELNFKEGDRMAAARKLTDFRASISLNAPTEAIFMERFDEFNEWFITKNILED